MALVTLLLAGHALFFLVRRLGRARPGLAIGRAIGAALMIRVMASAAVSATTFASQLRGSDEVAFKYQAGLLADKGGDWGYALTHELQEVIIGLQYWMFDSPDFALRITMAAIGVAGLALIATSVYELAGPRPALICAWILALEPSNIFFSTLLHKESLMTLAAGLIVFGGTGLWKRGSPRYLLVIALGSAIAISTRFYAGWFLMAAGAAICLHAGLRPGRRGTLTSLSLVSVVLLFVAVSAPTFWNSTTEENLQPLQVSQNANANDESNLKLEQVDFSTRTALITNLPGRLVDVLVKPYPWQLGSVSQQIGLIGTAVSYTTILLLLGAIVRRRGQIMEIAAPFVYTSGFLLVAYALSSGNAGTAFRYRVNVLVLAIALVITLRMASARAPTSDRVSLPAADRASTRPALVTR